MMNYSYEFPRPAVCCDVVLFTEIQEELCVLLIQRGRDPFQGTWALPGGFVDHMEDLEAAALRELEEETSLRLERLIQLGAYGKPGRDPRGHTVSIVFYTEVEYSVVSPALKAADDAKDADFFRVASLPSLAFDHDEIIQDALALRRKE